MTKIFAQWVIVLSYDYFYILMWNIPCSEIFYIVLIGHFLVVTKYEYTIMRTFVRTNDWDPKLSKHLREKYVLYYNEKYAPVEHWSPEMSYVIVVYKMLFHLQEYTVIINYLKNTNNTHYKCFIRKWNVISRASL